MTNHSSNTPSSPAPPHTSQHQSSGQAITSMVLGIVSLIGCMMWGLPSVVCGPLALMFAKKANEAIATGEAPPSSESYARAGRVCGLIGTILGGIGLLLGIVYLVVMLGFFGFAISQGGVSSQPAP